MEYLTDAHALLWHLYGPQRLGAEARQAFADADAGQACIHVPAVVIAEALMVVQKGRLRGVTLAHLLPRLDAMATSDNYPLCPLLPHTVIARSPLADAGYHYPRLRACCGHLGLSQREVENRQPIEIRVGFPRVILPNKAIEPQGDNAE